MKGERSVPINPKDREILRDLAKQVAEVASLPVMAERTATWKRHNALQRVRPMILVFPEGSWRELLPGSALACTDEKARGIEWNLRARLYQHEHIHHDLPIEKDWTVGRAISNTGWGMEARHIPSTDPTGAWKFDPIIHTPDDLEKLKLPEVRVDDEATKGNLAEAQDLFGDILDVQLKGVAHVSFHLMGLYCQLRGLEQVMLDMYENPKMLHDAMAFLEEGNRRLVEQYIKLNLFSLNNDGTYHSSGGVGYTDELPKPDYDPNRIRPCDMWSSAEAQEMALVSPAQHVDARWDIGRRTHLDREAEAVEELRAKLALLRVAAADQHEARRMAYREALALDDVLAGGRDVDQQVHEVILEQVDLVDVEKAAVRAGEEAWLEGAHALGQRALEIERPDDAILGRAERQVDDRYRSLVLGKFAGLRADAAVIAVVAGLRRIAAVAAAGDDLHRRQQRRECANSRGLAGTAVAKHEHTADRRIDGSGEQRQFHFLLGHDRRERKNLTHALSDLCALGAGG